METNDKTAEMQTYNAARKVREEDTASYIRPEVIQFAKQMEDKLRKNDHKTPWKDCTLSYLFARLNDEMSELYGAIESESPAGVVDELIDVANYCMMMVDRLRGEGSCDADI